VHCHDCGDTGMEITVSGGAAREQDAAVDWRIFTSMFSASGWCTRKRSSGSSSFRMGCVRDFRQQLSGSEPFDGGPVAGFAVRFRRPLGVTRGE
jgi:hypothetical protein